MNIHHRFPGWVRALIMGLLLCGAVICLLSFPHFYQAEMGSFDSIVPIPAPSPTPLPIVSNKPSPTPSPTPEPFVIPPLLPYSDTVLQGQIRYVSQLKNLHENGWGKYSSIAGSECTTACISMALSYLGIDASPEDILSFSRRTVLSSSYGLDEFVLPSGLTATALPKEDRFPVFEEMFSQYTSCRDFCFSPVLVYLQGFGHNHAILIIGKDELGYISVDPAPEGLHHVEIHSDGKITTTEEDYLQRYLSTDSPAVIHSLAQWQLCSSISESLGDSPSDEPQS